MRNSCFQLPEKGNNSSLSLRKPHFYCNRSHFVTTLENRSSALVALPTAEKAESFLKKTHTKFQIRYKNSQEGLLFHEAKEILSKPESHYTAVANSLNFTDWQTKLLLRDIGNLKEMLSTLPNWQQHDDDEKFSCNRLFAVIQEFLSQSENNISNKKKQQGHLQDFLVRLNFNLRISPHLEVISYDCSPQVREYSADLKRLELIIKNIQIKTSVKGYQSAVFDKHQPEKSEPLYFKKCIAPSSKGGAALMITARRVVRELEELAKLPPDTNCFIIPSNHDIRVWTAVIVGAPESIYHGGIFYVSIVLPKDYPFRPPRMTFLNRIFHPQVNEEGKISLDVLRKGFVPQLTVQRILWGLCRCLRDPMLRYFLENSAKEVFLKKEGNLKEIALEYIEKYA